MNESWFAAKTIVGREERVAARYSRFETFLPLTRIDRVVCRRTDRIPVPLFRGYFFLRCEMDLRPTRRDDFWGLLGAEGPGIGEPLALDDGIILELRERCDRGNGAIVLPSKFKPGQSVQIVGDDTYFGQIGLYQGQTDDERSIVLLSMFNGGFRVPLEFSSAALRAMEIQ